MLIRAIQYTENKSGTFSCRKPNYSCCYRSGNFFVPAVNRIQKSIYFFFLSEMFSSLILKLIIKQRMNFCRLNKPFLVYKEKSLKREKVIHFKKKLSITANKLIFNNRLLPYKLNKKKYAYKEMLLTKERVILFKIKLFRIRHHRGFQTPYSLHTLAIQWQVSARGSHYLDQGLIRSKISRKRSWINVYLSSL